MPGVHDLALFVASGILLNLTPGADTLYIVTRGTTLGRKAGAVAALGIAAGCCVHIVAAGLGLSVLLATSATAFTAVKLAGAAYLIYMGIGLWRSGPRAPDPAAKPPPAAPLSRIFVQGMLTNILNPKVALFFVAFLPQFVDAEAPHRLAAFLVLGTIFNTTGLVWNLFVAWSSEGIGRRMGGLFRHMHALHRIAGAVFVALGVKLAFSVRPTA
ncbi:MAG TPA: LysE family translocator [Casimicrobiaceae bacterium]|jgi:RhtB (resistance to homoserine/threonine) family protein